MRILRLDLLAFGPFTRQELALDKDEQGLHIVYGPNEAGKSSTLRALRTLLYGFHPQTPDDFVHPYKELRVGAVLHDGNGRTLACIRRKGNKNTLRGPDDAEIVDEGLLRELLSGVSEDAFCRQFGIDHAQLVAGGRDIVAGGGEIGQILFAAASGFAQLNDVRRSLAEEAEALFTPTATTRTINKSLAALKEKRKAARDEQLSSSDWKKHRDALSAAEAEREELERQRKAHSAELSRLERISRALPDIARRREVLEELERLSDVPWLPPDFADRRRRAELERTKAELQERNASENIENLTREIERLPVDEALLAREDEIQALKDELSVHEKAARDSRDRAREREQLLREAREILREIGRDDLSVEDAKELRLNKNQRQHVLGLVREYSTLVERANQAEERSTDLGKSLEASEEELRQLAPACDCAALRRALARLQKQGDLAARLSTLEKERRRAADQAQIDLKKLPRWQGTLAELESLAAPSAETIAEFERRFDAVGKDCERLETECTQAGTRLADLDEKLRRLDFQHDVPTEDDLAAARELREEGWRLVQSALHGKSPDSAAFLAEFRAASLEEAYPRSVQRADELSDRLRREAERVGEKSQLLAQQAKEQRRLEDLAPQRQAAAERSQACRAQWQEHWRSTGIEPLSPREMRAWLAQVCDLRDAAAALRRQSDEIESVRRQIDDHRGELRARLGELQIAAEEENPPLEYLVALCEEVVQQSEQLRAQRERLDSDAARQRREGKTAAAELQKAKNEIEQWRRRWKDATQQLRLENADPALASAVLEEINQLFIKIDNADQLSQRIEDMTEEMNLFARHVAALCKDLAPELANLPFPKAVGELYQRLQTARKANSTRQELEKQLGEANRKRGEAQEGLQNAQAELTALCQEAGCQSPEELGPLEEKAAIRWKLREQLQETEDRLHVEAAGRPLTDFVVEALAEDPDRLPADITDLRGALEAVNSAWGEVKGRIGAEQTELAKMDGNARAAAAQEEAEQLLAQLRDDGERYVRLRLAAEVLRGAIERRRARSQGPVLERASELFRDLTLGSFAGLRVDFDDQGEAVLVGVRPGGQTVSVKGMSDGSCDQLYLALRLASLEHYFQSHPPLPFIVDDILITFDDDRAAAALAALADLSRRTQVIFFTHHARLVELARTRLSPRLVAIHQLANPRAFADYEPCQEASERRLFV
jgi:uncharacterized protein YhaN